MTTIRIVVDLSPVDIRTLDKLKSKLNQNNSEVVTKAIRTLAFSVGLENVIEQAKKSHD